MIHCVGRNAPFVEEGVRGKWSEQKDGMRARGKVRE